MCRGYCTRIVEMCGAHCTRITGVCGDEARYGCFLELQVVWINKTRNTSASYKLYVKDHTFILPRLLSSLFFTYKSIRKDPRIESPKG